jgi:hypothetical protein
MPTGLRKAKLRTIEYKNTNIYKPFLNIDWNRIMELQSKRIKRSKKGFSPLLTNIGIY